MDSSIDPTNSIARARISELLVKDRTVSGPMPTQANNERFGDGKSLGKRPDFAPQNSDSDGNLAPEVDSELSDVANGVDFYA